jgi:hypothetical protein
MGDEGGQKLQTAAWNSPLTSTLGTAQVPEMSLSTAKKVFISRRAGRRGQGATMTDWQRQFKKELDFL